MDEPKEFEEFKNIVDLPWQQFGFVSFMQKARDLIPGFLILKI